MSFIKKLSDDAKEIGVAAKTHAVVDGTLLLVI